MKKLQGQELYRRLQEARNAKKLLQRAYDLIEGLKHQIVLLKEQNTLQAQQIELLKKINAQQALRIEYLEKIVFGRSKKNKPDQHASDQGGSSSPSKPAAPRDAKTYQRSIPAAEEITDTITYGLSACPDCHVSLTEVKIVQRYVEDIVLPEKIKNPLKRTEKQLIESGFCPGCKAQKSALAINGSKVILGDNVKIMVVYLLIVMRKSYEQIKNMFRDIWHIKLSDGEIAALTLEQANRLSLEHEKIQGSIRGQPSHKDETVWKVSQGMVGNYCWINTGSKTADTEFLFGRTRGKGNAQELQGKSSQAIITDDYAAYDGISPFHQLCWAHPLRKLRDLKESLVFDRAGKKGCEESYFEFKKLYESLRRLSGDKRPFAEKSVLKQKYLAKFLSITRKKKHDPEKLHTIKTTLRKDAQKYFTFLDIEGLPMDNNQAERRLRHVVLKRKVSLGSKTDQGAKTLEKLFSVVLTWWWRDPVNFISNYRHLLA